MRLLLLLLSLTVYVICHCPHMMGIKMAENSGPSAPGKLPDGDKGWDWDEPSGAPGSAPEEQFIQTSFVHRSNTDSEKKYALKVAETLKKVQENLKKAARVTVDNENIECASPDSHYRCSDFPNHGSYHFMVVEDSSRGAAVYSLDKKYNEVKEGSVEMAILDALSRHSPNSLMMFVSKENEKDVGFVRQLSTRELTAMVRKPGEEAVAKFSPFELQLIEPSLLELRHGEGLDTVSHHLKSFSSQSQFDEALKKHQHLFVLFWSNVHAQSLHTFNLWAAASNIWKDETVALAHVECHKHAEFCDGLKTKDFHTVVAFRNEEKVASTSLTGNSEYYLTWMRLIMNGPLVQLQDQEGYSEAKKGLLSMTSLPAVTIGVFPETVGNSFQHFSIAAEKLNGRYAVAYYIKEGSVPSLSTYRPSEKKRKRWDYEGRFDPASIISFITQSTLPTVIDISSGFTTDLLFRQPRSIACLLAPPSFDPHAFEKLAAREDLKKSTVFTRIVRDENPAVDEVLDRLFIEKREEPRLVLFNKDKVYYLELLSSNTAEELLQWIQHSEFIDPDLVLSSKDVHPLRMLQVHQVNEIFGKQSTIILPDHTLFNDMPPAHLPSEFRTTGGGGGGCPFMQGGGASHDEL